jgi:hypothetical protein
MHCLVQQDQSGELRTIPIIAIIPAAGFRCVSHNQTQRLGAFTASTAEGEAFLPGGFFRGLFHSVVRAASTRLDLGNFQIVVGLAIGLAVSTFGTPNHARGQHNPEYPFEPIES